MKYRAEIKIEFDAPSEEEADARFMRFWDRIENAARTNSMEPIVGSWEPKKSENHYGR